MNAPASITVTPVRVAYLLAEGEQWPVYVHVIDHPDARVLVDTGMTELHPEVADLDPRLLPLSKQTFDLAGIDVVVNTHLHFDHCGGNHLFAGRPIYVQRRELDDAVGYSAPGLVPGQEHAVGKRPGLHQVQVDPVVQGREERRAAAHQDRVGDDRVLVDQPGPHGRRGEGGAADVHGTAILSLEPGDLGDSVAGDQAGVPADRRCRRRAEPRRHAPPAG